MKTDEREWAGELRALGWSISEIPQHVSVSRSSISKWIRDVPLSEAQTEDALYVAGCIPYGTCRLVVHSSEIVQTIYGSIQEYGGFDRPEWLD